MTDRRKLADASSQPSSSGLSSAGTSQGPLSNSVRSRNRRYVSSTEAAVGSNLGQRDNAAGLSSASRVVDPLSPVSSSDRDKGMATLGQFLGDSWAQGWSSVQELANVFLPVSDSTVRQGRTSPQLASRDSQGRGYSKSSVRNPSRTWGPAPLRKPGIGEAAAAAVPEREATLKAMRTASILESHEGVNGGLDVTGRHKRRNSGEPAPKSPLSEDCLVYIHHVQPDDTYAGLVLRYRCREDVFRRANGLWSGDSIQTRKWLAMPVDACDARGRPCETPRWYQTADMDAISSTQSSNDAPQSIVNSSPTPASGDMAERKQAQLEDEPWTHVRWVHLDSLPRPVQICRVTRQTLGYFPPRRKRSIRTTSSLSTPRQSSDFSNRPLGTTDQPKPRRLSIGSRPHPCDTAASSHDRLGSESDISRPSWMRRPGGVGSLSRSVRGPGPDSDYLNEWTTKHLPSLNIDGLPSMSVMGSDTARFGFSSEPPEIVESQFKDGHDTASFSRQGSGLDRAAAAVEGWLRVALAKRPNTPMIGRRARQTVPSTSQGDGDLIELENTGYNEVSINSDFAIVVDDSIIARTKD